MRRMAFIVVASIAAAVPQFARAQQDEAGLDAMRRANRARIEALAGAASINAPSNGASAAQDPRSTLSYAGKVAASVKPNIVYFGSLDSNGAALVEVRMAPDGNIVGRRLLKSSGVRDWDDAVIKALDRTGTMPRDIDGRVPPVMEISFRQRYWVWLNNSLARTLADHRTVPLSASDRHHIYTTALNRSNL